MKFSSPRLLLTTVFKPYGIADGYSEALGMQMELFSNQITREQGVHSPRSNYWTFPLYFLAENISIPSTVLDFPSWRDFVRELRNGYTHVGLSFIQTNVLKAARMAEYVREHFPGVKIILGGYGSMLPDIKDLVPHDELCVGDGIRFMRRYFGEDPEMPVRHPVLNGVATKRIYGLSTGVEGSAVLFPGLGCPNGCFFCSTSAMFKREYLPILGDGRSVFEACRRAEEKLGVKEFAIIDENFLKLPGRARELLNEMEENGKAYNFAIFSSAEVLTELGVDFLVRLGVSLVWIGIESEKDIFEKLADIDVRGLIRRLQAHGVSVISSSILFLDHHDRDNLDEAIDWAIGMKSDFHQFMQLTPLPGTPLFDDYAGRGLLTRRFPYTRMSGQDALNFKHPCFDPEEATELTRRAFDRFYRTNGPSVLNMAHTFVTGYIKAVKDYAARGHEGLSWSRDELRYTSNSDVSGDEFMQMRLKMMKARALSCRPILTAARIFGPNAASRSKARRTAELYDEAFGRADYITRLKQGFLLVSGFLEKLRIDAHRVMGWGDLVRNPPTRRVEYRSRLPQEGVPGVRSGR